MVSLRRPSRTPTDPDDAPPPGDDGTPDVSGAHGSGHGLEPKTLAAGTFLGFLIALLWPHKGSKR